MKRLKRVLDTNHHTHFGSHKNATAAVTLWHDYEKFTLLMPAVIASGHRKMAVDDHNGGVGAVHDPVARGLTGSRSGSSDKLAGHRFVTGVRYRRVQTTCLPRGAFR